VISRSSSKYKKVVVPPSKGLAIGTSALFYKQGSYHSFDFCLFEMSLAESFTLSFGKPILPGLVVIGKYDGIHPCLT